MTSVIIVKEGGEVLQNIYRDLCFMGPWRRGRRRSQGLVSDLAEGVDISVFSKQWCWFGWFSLSGRHDNRLMILRMWQGTEI